jgi:hypothetical protein
VGRSSVQGKNPTGSLKGRGISLLAEATFSF